MRVVAAMMVIDVKIKRGYGEREAYSPKEVEYLHIAEKTGLSSREIYTMFCSPEMLGEPI